jgi:hypothetical protein
MEFGVLGDEGLLEEHRFLRVKAGSEIVGDDFDGISGNGGGVRIVASEGVPVRDEIKAIEGRIILEADPILQRAEIVADVQLAGGAHAAEDAIFLSRCGGQVLPVIVSKVVRNTLSVFCRSRQLREEKNHQRS